jgi:hypothetical protein
MIPRHPSSTASRLEWRSLPCRIGECSAVAGESAGNYTRRQPPLEGGDATNDAFFVRGVKLMFPDE